MGFPAATGIGMVNASGTFQVDHARVVGNAVAGGVAAAGTVAGLGVTGSLPGQGGDSTQNSSR